MAISAPPIDYGALAPFLVLVAGAALGLLVELYLPPSRRSLLGYLGLATVAIAAASSLPLWNAPRSTFNGMVEIDRFGLVVVFIVLVATGLSILMGLDFLPTHGLGFGEYYPLLLFTASGMVLLALASDLILVFLALEVLSLGLYVLAGFARGNASAEEAALKYFLLGSFSLGFLVYGTSLVYGATGTTGFAPIAERVVADGLAADPLLLVGMALILVGLGFKAALVPFHMWTPDVYYGAPTPVTAFMSVGTKAVAFAALARFLVAAVPDLRASWALLLWSLAIITMLVGNLAGLTQRNIKRLLAYSSIGQAGYILVAVIAASSQDAGIRASALGSMLFYLAVYTFMNLGAFGVVLALAGPGSERLGLADDFAGLASRQPLLAGAMTVFLLSLAGVPPTAGFVAKLLVFRAAVNAGFWPLVLIGVLTSVIALAYYLRVIVLMFGRDRATTDGTETAGEQRSGLVARVGVATCIVATIGFGIMPGGLIDMTWQTLSRAPR